VREGPGTLDELHAAVQADQDRRRAEQEAAAAAEAQRLRELAARPKRPITLAEIEGIELPTLRQAAATIAAVHGRVEANDGHVRVSVPDGLEDPAPAITAARVLVAAPELVLQALGSKSKQPLAATLPDKPVLAGGGA
jgi:hypothetical protein